MGWILFTSIQHQVCSNTINYNYYYYFFFNNCKLLSNQIVLSFYINLNHNKLVGLTWEAGLKFTKVKLDLITDPDLHLFFEDSIRGGISTITTRYARADKRTDGYTQSTMNELV